MVYVYKYTAIVLMSISYTPLYVIVEVIVVSFQQHHIALI